MKALNYSWIGTTTILIFFISWFMWIGSFEQYQSLKVDLIFNILKRVLGVSILGGISILILFLVNYLKTKDISKTIIICSYGLLINLLFSFLGSLMFFKNLIIE